MYYTCADTSAYIGDLDVKGGYVERGTDMTTGLPYRAAPSSIDRVVNQWWGQPDTSEGWEKWFAEPGNFLNNADDGTYAQTRAEMLDINNWPDRATGGR